MPKKFQYKTYIARKAIKNKKTNKFCGFIKSKPVEVLTHAIMADGEMIPVDRDTSINYRNLSKMYLKEKIDEFMPLNKQYKDYGNVFVEIQGPYIK